MLAVRFNDDTIVRFCVGAHKLEEVIAVKHDSSSSTSCNQSANTVNAVSDDSDSISSSTDVPPEYTKDEYKKPAVTAKMFAITGFAITDFILFDLLG